MDEQAEERTDDGDDTDARPRSLAEDELRAAMLGDDATRKKLLLRRPTDVMARRLLLLAEQLSLNNEPHLAYRAYARALRWARSSAHALTGALVIESMSMHYYRMRDAVLGDILHRAATREFALFGAQLKVQQVCCVCFMLFNTVLLIPTFSYQMRRRRPRASTADSLRPLHTDAGTSSWGPSYSSDDGESAPSVVYVVMFEWMFVNDFSAKNPFIVCRRKQIHLLICAP